MSTLPPERPDGFYPPIEPFAADRLPVGGGHVIHVEQCGNPHGFPALFVHGGPGSRALAQHRRFFDPQFYRIVLADQRGCGQSTPRGGTERNTTPDLVEDIEAVRRHLGLERALLFGGSWGSTLALAYAGDHPDRVAGMVLRGIFLASRAELDWYLSGLRNFVPEAWDVLANGDSEALVARYHRLVNAADEGQARAAAERWVGYEEAVMRLGSGSKPAATPGDPAAALARARIQLHYLAHDSFLAPGALLASAGRLAGVPAIIVQGRLDMVCPPHTAFELARRLPQADLRIVEDGGHSATEPAMARALVRATDEMRQRLERSR